jgi:hypothetical protein
VGPRPRVIVRPRGQAGRSSSSWGQARPVPLRSGEARLAPKGPNERNLCPWGQANWNLSPEGRVKPRSHPLIIRLILIVGGH